ncbi:response regulator [Lichenihabitans sp. Uapishka_5]|uniref:response regulator n=1 Tax=Lichenihabitans sp. Uapishka_5 TaxID=3037302 RepID=UPI0029E7F35F|nr:response regulator [Lichenihabitans sp. Uapishka_5]MDX7950372.1 response regulator [Lichenihabitans sp. Uapishka_5]
MPRTIVLVVEDDPMNRLLAVDALERSGFEVVDFSNADAAALYANQGAENIVALLADVNVPGECDGLDFAADFARRWPEKFVLVTSGCTRDDVMAGLPTSIDFLPKPWTAKMLMDRIAAARPGGAA